MASTKNPKPRSSEFWVTTVDDRPIIGTRVRETPEGVRLRTPEGEEVDCPAGAKLSASASPDILKRAPFAPPTALDADERLATLVELFRTECATGEERRRWADGVAGAPLPAGRPVDELIRFRYEELRREWRTALRELLLTQPPGASDRLLLSALDPARPSDVRQVAARAAVELGRTSVVPLLCSAILHRTQTAFGREAARAVARLAPDRLLLLTRTAPADTAKAVDVSVVESLPEWRLLDGPADAESPWEPDRLFHLLLGLPIESQLRWLASDMPPTHRAAIVENARDQLASLSRLPSAPAYESLLRSTISQFLLAADEWIGAGDVRQRAAAIVARDVEASAIRALAAALPARAAGALVSECLASARRDVATGLIDLLAHERQTLLAVASKAVRELVKAEPDASELWTSGLGVLCGAEEAHEFVAREFRRRLRELSESQVRVLMQRMAVGRVPIDAGTLPLLARSAMIDALASSDALYASELLTRLVEGEDPTSDASAITALALPHDWIESSSALRAIAFRWLPHCRTSGVSLAADSYLTISLVAEARGLFRECAAPLRAIAIDLLLSTGDRKVVQSAVGAVAALPNHEPARGDAVAQIVGRLLAAPDTWADVSTMLLDEEVRRALLAHGATALRAKAVDSGAHAERESGRAERLRQELTLAIELAQHALGPNDALGALMARASQDLDAISPTDVDANEEVSSFLKEHAGADAWPAREAPLAAALRGLDARNRSSASVKTYFRRQVDTLIASAAREDLERFAVAQQRLLSRLDFGTVELVSGPLLRLGSSPILLIDLIGGPTMVDQLVGCALRGWDEAPEASVALLDAAAVTTAALWSAVRDQTERSAAQRSSYGASDTPIARVAAALASTLSAADGIMLNYARVRSALDRNGLSAVEPVLGRRLRARELVSGRHRTVGAVDPDGEYEVQSHGLQETGTDRIISPALVALVAFEDVS